VFFGFQTNELIVQVMFSLLCDVSMLMRIVRRLTLDEVKSKIKHFEKEHAMTFDEFEEMFLRGKLDRRMVGTYFEWASLVHAYRGYVKGGELDYAIEELRDLSPEETALLTPKRIELLYSIASLRAESLNKLAQKTKRNVKNVYLDLKALQSLGFVAFRRRDRRNIIPETLVEEISLLIR